MRKWYLKFIQLIKKSNAVNAFKSAKINQKVKLKIYDPAGKLEEGIGTDVD